MSGERDPGIGVEGTRIGPRDGAERLADGGDCFPGPPPFRRRDCLLLTTAVESPSGQYARATWRRDGPTSERAVPDGAPWVASAAGPSGVARAATHPATPA